MNKEMYAIVVYIKDMKSSHTHIFTCAERGMAIGRAKGFLKNGIVIGDNDDDIIECIPASQIIKCIVKKV